MNKQSKEFMRSMDNVFGVGKWSFNNFTDGSIHFISLDDLKEPLMERVAMRYPKLMPKDIVAYNSKPGLVTDKSHLYKPLTLSRMERIKPAILAIAKA